MLAKNIIQEHIAVMEDLQENCLQEIEKFALICGEALKTAHTVYFCGNGGSAADSQHLAAEFVGRFQKERHGLAAVALNDNIAILTSVSNDYGYDEVFSRQVAALVNEKDVVVGLSTSGTSQNVARALEMARQLGAVTVGLMGKKQGSLEEYADLCIKVPSAATARIQEAHIVIGHIVCQFIDEVFGDVQK